jgi:cob(I)alamin adenosyltransferase
LTLPQDLVNDNVMKIYTRTGDAGKTRLLGGCLVDKYDLRIEAYGSMDELNSMLGLLQSELIHAKPLTLLHAQIEKVQSELFVLGSQFACEDPQRMKDLPKLNAARVGELEVEIDQMTEKLELLKQFIIPGGHMLSAFLHVVRTLCRRCERNAVKLHHDHPSAETELAIQYLNRPSDYFFTAARFANHCMNVPDRPWVKP